MHIHSHIQMLMIEQGSINHNIYIVLHLSKGMVVIIDIHLDSFPKCLYNTNMCLIRFNFECHLQ